LVTWLVTTYSIGEVAVSNYRSVVKAISGVIGTVTRGEREVQPSESVPMVCQVMVPAVCSMRT